MKYLKYSLSLFVMILCTSCAGLMDSAKDSDKAKDKTFKGMFTYMADANMFFPCDGSQRMPVAMTGEYLTLERKYTALSKGNGERIYSHLEGYTKEVPAMEGNGTTLAIVVTKVVEVNDGKSCE